ncbi:MAG: sigma 54-interacting transcriptional regulator [Lachnospiraceae bacterium]|nr:sigma 54-interacting transcriptional regulator [Lachnospiraceae bacterium]
MKKTKDLVYEFIQKETYSQKDCGPGFQTSEIADALGMQRTNVSAILNMLVKEGLLTKTKTRPVCYALEKEERVPAAPLAFESLVGHDGSLRKAIQLARAAILYPGGSLSIHIIARPGAGISYFAEQIHQFAVERRIVKEDAPYIKVNCRYYTKNISVLDDVLFGDSAGIENSSFAKAQGGILFIDNVDLMSARQQGRLFRFLETGEIEDAGGAVSVDLHNLIFVFAQADTGDERLEWKNQITIELPTLEERPLSEKMDLINLFFSDEAANAKCCVQVTREAASALLGTQFEGNIKELCAQIKSACASAYIRVLEEPEDQMLVCLNDFSQLVQRSSLLYKNNWLEVNTLLGDSNFFLYEYEEGGNGTARPNLAREVDDNIRVQYAELTGRDVSTESIHSVIDTYISTLMSSLATNREKNKEINLEQLSKSVDQRIIDMVSVFFDKLKKDMGREYNSNVFYGVCLHLNSLLTMNPVEHTRVTDEQIRATIQEYPREYAAVLDLANHAGEHLGLSLDIAEVVLLTMFIILPRNEAGRPVLLYCMHGRGAARYLAETTNMLTQSDKAYAFDIDLSTEIKQAMGELEETLLKIDRGGGVIVIYDMGSFKSMIEMLQEKLTMKIRAINMPITMVGLEVARRCDWNEDIDQVYHQVNRDLGVLQRSEEQHKKLIITLCYTSEGGAAQLKRYIDQYSRLGFRTVALAVANKDALVKEVLSLRKIYDIHAFVGTFDPKLFGIPFISIATVFENRKEDLDRILMFEPMGEQKVNYDALLRKMEEQFENISTDKLRKVLPGIVEELGDFYQMKNEDRIGIFVHLASLMERLAIDDHSKENEGDSVYISRYKSDYVFLSKLLKPLERQFKVIINDNEMGTMLMIIKQAQD